jgi:hypothetical protein
MIPRTNGCYYEIPDPMTPNRRIVNPDPMLIGQKINSDIKRITVVGRL